MLIKQAFDYIVAPLDEYHMCALRNAVLCGILAFVLIIVGVNQLIMFVIYIFVITVICFSVWLYSLTPTIRSQVLDRIKDVAKAFWRNCVDESFGSEKNIGPNTQEDTDDTEEDDCIQQHAGEGDVGNSKQIHELSIGFAKIFQ